MEHLPTEIILEIFRSIYLKDEIKHIRYLTRIGTVNRYIHRVEQIFWKQRLIYRNGSRLSGVLRKYNSPKLTYLRHYFGCTFCDQLAAFHCDACSSIACSDCVMADFDCKCIRKKTYKCPEHMCGRCNKCNVPLCSDCYKMCWMCQSLYCNKCIYLDDEYPGNHCGDCYEPVDPDLVPASPDLPFEVWMDIFRLIFNRSGQLIDRVKQIIRIGAISTLLHNVEQNFWDGLVNDALLELLPNYNPAQRPNFFFLLGLTNMPIKLRDNPKQLYLYCKFSCQQCGQKATLTQCQKCRMFVCNYCGHNRQCYCIDDDFLCYYCHYTCPWCNRDLCLNCVGLCRYCRLFFCPDCHKKRHTCKKADLLLQGEWPLIDRIGTCIKCEEEIYKEEDLGHCPSCEYYNEINEYKLCSKCIDTCQICQEEYCTNCIIMYHEPCEQWTLCPSCKSEVSTLRRCYNCGSDDHVLHH